MNRICTFYYPLTSSCNFSVSIFSSFSCPSISSLIILFDVLQVHTYSHLVFCGSISGTLTLLVMQHLPYTGQEIISESLFSALQTCQDQFTTIHVGMHRHLNASSLGFCQHRFHQVVLDIPYLLLSSKQHLDTTYATNQVVNLIFR